MFISLDIRPFNFLFLSLSLTGTNLLSLLSSSTTLGLQLLFSCASLGLQLLRLLSLQLPSVLILQLLLQALRWRLTKPARRQRRTALAQFAQNDLLEPRLLEALLGPDAPPMVREQALRLVNLFASEVGGRSYLLSQPDSP